MNKDTIRKIYWAIAIPLSVVLIVWTCMSLERYFVAMIIATIISFVMMFREE